MISGCSRGNLDMKVGLAAEILYNVYDSFKRSRRSRILEFDVFRPNADRDRLVRLPSLSAQGDGKTTEPFDVA